MIKLIDTHAHLTDEKLISTVEDIIENAKLAGVKKIISCGYDIESSLKSVEFSLKYDEVYATFGIHPHDANKANEESFQVIKEHLNNPKIVAIGECGLDFHYNLSPKDDQIKCFIRHLEIASEYNMPVSVHSRESMKDIINILSDFKDNITGVLHFFTGNFDEMEKLYDMGFYFGIDGPVTFKSGGDIRNLVKKMPLDRIVLETDCPYMTPVPNRGKINQPSYLTYVLETVSEIKEISPEELSETIWKNTLNLFPRLR